MSDYIPEAPSTPGAAPKKDHTAAIVVTVVVLCVFVLPIIIGTIIVFRIFSFVEDHIGDMTISDIIHEIEYSEIGGVSLTTKESAAVRNYVSQIENKTLESRSISLVDCRYLERIASYYTANDDQSAPISLCDGETISATVEKVAPKDSKVSDNYFDYKLTLKSDKACAYFVFDKLLGVRKDFESGSKYCADISLNEFKIVDTGEELEPLPAVNYEKDADEDDGGVTINIKSRA